MTALAMIIGMLPMSLGLGEGGEQNAPLGRAVIGGLLFATVATLFFVPTVFAMIHGQPRSQSRLRGSRRISEIHTRKMEVQYNSAGETETLREATPLGWYMPSEQDDAIDDGTHAAPEITPPPKLAPASPRKALLFVGVIVLVLAVAAVITVLTRMHDSRVLADETAQNSIPTVAVVHPIAEKPDEELVLPGTLQAYVESPIYARTNGYLLRWYKDIGSHVQQGELLADIDTPEVDQELMQAARLASRWSRRWTWPRSTPIVTSRCARPTRFRSRKPTPDQRLSAGAGQSGRCRRQR